jgi:hypothetical protein
MTEVKLQVLALIVSSTLAFGCIATRYSPYLDHQLTAEGVRFLDAKTVEVLESLARERYDAAPRLADNLRKSIAQAPDEPRSIIKASDQQKQVSGWCNWDSYNLVVITAGLIPQVCRFKYNFRVTVEDRGSTTSHSQEYSATRVYGLAGLILSPFPDWEFTPDYFIYRRRESTRGFYTVINRISAPPP